MSNKEINGSTNDEHHDSCWVCEKGGNLLCCDTCNLSYHLKCVKLRSVPRGSWSCPVCLDDDYAKKEEEEEEEETSSISMVVEERKTTKLQERQQEDDDES